MQYSLNRCGLVDSQSIKHYVVFKDSNNPRVGWFKKGFRHCFLLRKDYDCLFTIIEGHYNLGTVRYESLEDCAFQDVVGDGTVVEVDVNISARCAYSLNFITCVGLIKYFLGVSYPFVFTPYQLYKRLKKCQQSKIHSMRSQEKPQKN